MYRSAATLVAKILDGARPSDLPIERPVRFELVVNVKTAKTLGLTVPPSLLSVFAFPGAFFHNGAAPSLDDVLQNVTHRSAGTGGVDTLTNAADRAAVARFLTSIDAATAPIP
jgi:cytochrome c peroxidase